ncbi:MAG: NTP transferase domain-containing protein [Planctomycetes bacterium]|nr:NTP transferase domain-containing protein [Planctomycetota bacterium]
MSRLKDEALVVILAGGQGTRIRSVYPDIPKPMITCQGRPFIDAVIRYFMSQGLHQFVIALGYLAEVAEDYFLHQRPDDGAEILLVQETEALGTGGGIRHALNSAPPGAAFVATNGDSLVLADLDPVWSLLENPAVDGLIIGCSVDDTRRYGTLDIGPDGMLVGFREKQNGRGVINAGVYILKSYVLEDFPDQIPLSMEHDVFPILLQRGRRLLVLPTDAPFVDIGTQESLRAAESFLDEHLPAGDGP